MGLDCPPWIVSLQEALRNGEDATSNPVIGDREEIALRGLLLDAAGHQPDPKILSRKCLEVHWRLADKVEAIMGVPPVLTIGDMTVRGVRICRFSREEALKDVRRTVLGSTVHKVHAWLTLPSLEIVDFTFMATYMDENPYARERARKSGEGPGVISRHWRDLCPAWSTIRWR